MDPGPGYRLLSTLLVGAALLAPRAAGGQASPADSLPPGVTRDMLQRGKALYLGAGLCLACHGPDGKGTLGPNLVDRNWLHIDGSYEAILGLVLRGVDLPASKTGQMMPPRGGSALKDEQVRAVAAYVWALSRGIRIP